MVCVGDFNARIRSKGAANLVSPGCINQIRMSQDQITNARGRKFLQILEEHELTILNGRSPGDDNGAVTFVTKNGSSCIDLCLANLNTLCEVKNFEILSWPYSHHFPLCLKLGQEIEKKFITTSTLKWRENCKSSYQLQVEQKVKNTTEVEQINRAILDVAKCIGMTSNNLKPISKSWFDKECSNARKLTNENFKSARRSGWMEASRIIYLHSKCAYKKLLQDKKAAHLRMSQNRINNCKNPQEFWKTVRSLRRVPTAANQVNSEGWFNFYKKILPPRSSPIPIAYEPHKYLANYKRNNE